MKKIRLIILWECTSRLVRVAQRLKLVSPSAGYREFDRYVELQDTAESQTAYELAVESMKRSTRKYAKRQVSWIKNKLIPAALRVNEGSPTGQITPFYLLDATGQHVFPYSNQTSDG